MMSVKGLIGAMMTLDRRGDMNLNVQIYCRVIVLQGHTAKPSRVEGKAITYYSGNGGHGTAWVPQYTSSLVDALSFIERNLPGWYWTAGLCELTGHATIGPDYNGSHRKRLLKEFPEKDWHEGISADLAPGNGKHRVAIALMVCALQALERMGKL